MRSTVSLQWALLQNCHPGVVSSDSVPVSVDQIFVKDPGSSPSSSWATPSSGPDSPRSLPADSDSFGIVSLSGVLPLMWGRRRMDGGPSGCPSPWPWYRPYCFRRVRTRSYAWSVSLPSSSWNPPHWSSLKPEAYSSRRSGTPCLHAVVMCVRQVIFPVQEGGIRPGLVGRAVRAHVNPTSSVLVHILVVLPHILSTPALGARHLLPQVTSSSGHPSGFGMGWLSGWQFV